MVSLSLAQLIATLRPKPEDDPTQGGQERWSPSRSAPLPTHLIPTKNRSSSHTSRSKAPNRGPPHSRGKPSTQVEKGWSSGPPFRLEQFTRGQNGCALPKMMFNPDKWDEDRFSTAKVAPLAVRKRVEKAPAGRVPGDVVESMMPDLISARVIGSKRHPIGYIRLWSFDVDDDQVYLEEVRRILGLLPQHGLVIDVRANPGGNIYACERILQLFTDRDIVPARFALRATALTARLSEVDPDLAPWAESLRLAMQTGEQYSQHLPISDAESCNDTGRQYPGPSVCVTDANTRGPLFCRFRRSPDRCGGVGWPGNWSWRCQCLGVL